MLQSILADIRREFSFGNVVTRLVIINVCVFIAVNLLRLGFYLGNAGIIPPLYRDILNFFSVSSELMHNLTHPWVFVTSIFLHEGFWHLLWNMLFLYWFGRIVGDLLGDRKVFPIYLLGGMVGCFVFWASAQLLPYLGGSVGYAMGASAGVMAIVVTAGMIAPDYIIRLLFIGEVKLKYVVAALVLLDLFAVAGNSNTGGHFAHIGGVIMGWLFVAQLQAGNDWSEGVNSILDRLERFFTAEKVTVKSTKEAKLVVKHTYRKKDPEQFSDDEIQERVDQILEKIKQKGYNSLSVEEKEFLNNASSR
ncbi:MAG: rhomboid family intramembrane serine protease [Saprospiraceae bacterium]|nr:rhomboid family intramembrane serine protease [Saprospiraceae bacterium]